MTRRKLVALSSSLLTFSAAIALTACGSEMGGDKVATPVGAQASEELKWGSPDVAANQRIHQAATASFEAWAGTPESLQALEVLRAYGLNGSFSECLSDRGIAQDWRATIGAPAVREHFGNAVLIPPTYRPSDDLPIQAWAERNDRWFTAYDPPTSDHQAQQECREANPPADEVKLNPPHYEKLDTLWTSSVTEATDTLRSGAKLERCVSDLPMSGSLANKSFDRRFAVLDAAKPAANQIPIGNEPPTQGWRSYRALEAELLAGYWECNRESYDEAMALMPGVISSFERENADQIEEASQFWATVESEAAALGWSVSEPLAGRPEWQVGE